MKTRLETYTMTWKVYGKFGCEDYSLCRERIWPFHRRFPHFDEPLEFYLWLIDDRSYHYGSAYKDFRLLARGRLVARSATYQGV